MKAHARFFFLILICILMVFAVGIASAEADGAKPFSTDYEAINEAAQSMFLVEIYGANDTLLGTGSGFIAFDEHYFVTNHHVIEDAKYLVVVDDNGKEYKVTDLLVADEEKDIAILSFEEAANYRPLPLCADENLLRGQPIVAIGSPKGVRNTVTTGNISNLIDDNGTHIIQFTAAASPGSSGGAIFNDRGEVIGLMFSKRTDAENMNYAIFIDEVEALKTTSNSVVPLSEINLELSEVLLIKNSTIEIETTIPLSSKTADVRLTFENTKRDKTITSIVLMYGYSAYEKSNILNIPEVSISPKTTRDYTVTLSHFNENSSQLYIGVRYVKFNDGTDMFVNSSEIKYTNIKLNQKQAVIPTLIIPSESIAEWEKTKAPNTIKARIQIENVSSEYDIDGYMLYFSEVDLSPKKDNSYSNQTDYLLQLEYVLYQKETYFTQQIEKKNKVYSGYFALEGREGLPKDLFVGIKGIRLSNGTYIQYENDQIIYSHWIVN